MPNVCGSFKLDSEVAHFCTAHGQTVNPAYGRSRGTHAAALSALMKYNHPSPPIALSPKVLARTRRLMLDWFKRWESTCGITPHESVYIPKGTHPGDKYKTQGYRDKIEVMNDPYSLKQVMDWYLNPQYPTLWKGSPKDGELLTRKKLESGDLRLFLIPGMDIHYTSLRLLQAQHELFAKNSHIKDWPFKIGYSAQYGGFTQLCKLLKSFMFIIEGDCSKWDASCLREAFFNFVIPLRVMLYNGVEMSKEEFKCKLEAMYEDVVRTMIIMPNGEIFIKDVGMPSGWFLTSDDNCIIHFAILLSWFVEHGKEDQLKRTMFALYADDHLIATDCKEFCSYEGRKAHYAKWGVTLKPEADRVSSDPVGHSFLGLTCSADERYGYVPMYNPEKALASLLVPGKNCSKFIRFVRINALRVLCYFTPIYPFLSDLGREMLAEKDCDIDPSEAAMVEWLSNWPTERSIRNLWMGDESGGLEEEVKFTHTPKGELRKLQTPNNLLPQLQAFIQSDPELNNVLKTTKTQTA